MAPARCMEARARRNYEFRYRLTRFARIGPTAIRDRFDASTRDKAKIVDLVNERRDARGAIILSVVLFPTSREDFSLRETLLVSLRALDFKRFRSSNE